MYISSLLGFWRFNSNLTESALNNTFVLNDNNSSTTGVAVSGEYDTFSRYDLFKSKSVNVKGLILDDVSYEAENSLLDESFTIAFWYKSSLSIGFTRNIITRDLEPKTIPIIAKSDNSINDVTESVTDCSFVITESAHTSTHNRIAVGLSATGTDLVYAYSEPYLPGTHLILVTYDATTNQVRIDIDGNAGDWTNSAELYVSTATLKLNSINPNYIHHQASGLSRLISELYIKTEVASDTESKRLYTYGVDYIIDDDLSTMQFLVLPILLSQPSTVSTTKIVAEGSNIYAARSDGTLLKGVQNFWDAELMFDSNKKNTFLNKSKVGTVSFTSDGAAITGAIIST